MGGIFRLIFSGPRLPAPPAAPAPAEADDARADRDGETARRERLRAAGRARTIVTGGLGDPSSARVATRTLVGGKRTLGQ